MQKTIKRQKKLQKTIKRQKKLYSYARISSRSQMENSSLATKKEALMAYGVEEQNIHTEVISGPVKHRPKLSKVLGLIGEGDVLVTFRLDRSSRSLPDTFSILALLDSKEAKLHSFSENIETLTPSGKLTFAVLAASAEFEWSVRKERVKTRLTAKVDAGFKFPGRKPLLTDELKETFYKYRETNDLSLNKIAAELNISFRCLENYLKAGFLRKKGPGSETKQINEFIYYKNKSKNEATFNKKK